METVQTEHSPETGPQDKVRLAWADLLRVAAMLAVITIHLCGGWLGCTPYATGLWWLFNLLDSLARWAVPVFVLISGMFFLDPAKPLTVKDLFCKYLLRICTALAVWTVFYVCLNNWPGKSHLSLGWFVSCLRLVIHGSTYYHLWYLFMTIGLYLVTPVLRVFVRNAQKRELHYILALSILFASLLPSMLLLFPSQTVQTCLSRINVTLVMGYVGLYVTGYYLHAYPPSDRTRKWIYGLGLVCAAFTVLGTWLFSGRDGVANFNLYSYNSPNIVLMALALFLLVQRHGEGLGSRRWIARVSRLSLGVYLVHPFFLDMLFRFGYGPGSVMLPPPLLIPLQFAILLAGSLAASWCISKIPILNRYLA
ncbi:MAG: hypothetical protein H6Q60_832 [Oscillospiraceae bacterium]|nr:hypothetical protein [Oscillospiraceae bacterium]